MSALYEIVVEEDGGYAPAPNPPPPEWRERKGICSKCGEKVFVKSGPLRTFWTHGRGKTCVPKPNPISTAISLMHYTKNRGASSEGDAEMRARFEAYSGFSGGGQTTEPTHAPTPVPVSEPTTPLPPVGDANQGGSHDVFMGESVRFAGPVTGEQMLEKNEQGGAPNNQHLEGGQGASWEGKRSVTSSKSAADWAPGEKEWWIRHLAEKRSRWRRG